MERLPSVVLSAGSFETSSWPRYSFEASHFWSSAVSTVQNSGVHRIVLKKIRTCWTEFLRQGANVSRRRNLPSLSGIETLEIRALPAASVLVTRLPDFFTTEAEGTAQFSVALSKAPRGKGSSVVIPISSSNMDEGVVDVTELTFTSTNWQVPQVVTITGVDDDIADGDRSYKIDLEKLILTKARNYRRVDPADVSIVNRDDDGPEPGLLFSPTGIVIDDSASRSVTVRLASRPTADVEVELSITDGDDQAQISTTLLTFTPANWNVDQSFLIGAFRDDVHDGDRPFEITAVISSEDEDYANLTDETFNATIHDVDPLAVSLDGEYVGAYTSENASDDSEPIEEPLEFVVDGDLLTVTSGDGGEGTVEGDSVTFTLVNGAIFTGTFAENTDGSVTASGTWEIRVDGVKTDGGTWFSEDLFHISPGLRISPRDTVVVDEGNAKDYYVSLTSAPTENVTVSFEINVGAGRGTLSKTTLTFTPSNWSLPQLVRFTALNHAGDDPDQTFEFEATTTSTDPDYTAIDPVILTLTIHDPVETPADLDGVYTGTFTGTLTMGVAIPVNGPVEFTVEGDQVTVTKPAAATGTIENGIISFSPSAGQLIGATFTGTFKDNGDGTIKASGQWIFSLAGATGSGTWTATRPASI